MNVRWAVNLVIPTIFLVFAAGCSNNPVPPHLRAGLSNPDPGMKLTEQIKVGETTKATVLELIGDYKPCGIASTDTGGEIYGFRFARSSPRNIDFYTLNIRFDQNGVVRHIGFREIASFDEC